MPGQCRLREPTRQRGGERQAGAARSLGVRGRARHGPDPAVERELADAGVLEQTLQWELVRTGE